MGQVAARYHYTFHEYLELEEVARVRHEFLGGDIFAMAGGTPEHAAMAAAITLQLGEQLRGSTCQTFSSDLRVRVLETGLATYPDVTVVCGKPERDPESPTHITNPKVVIEVLSPSTAEYDRTEKRGHYQRIASLEALLLVDHQGPGVDLWTREPTGWKQETFLAGSEVPLVAIGCTLSVDEIYAAAQRA
jgi:Uma2 family endonuclease